MNPKMFHKRMQAYCRKIFNSGSFLPHFLIFSNHTKSVTPYSYSYMIRIEKKNIYTHLQIKKYKDPINSEINTTMRHKQTFVYEMHNYKENALLLGKMG